MVSELFTLFDSSRSRVGILDWGIKMTTLEDGKADLYTLPLCCVRQTFNAWVYGYMGI